MCRTKSLDDEICSDEIVVEDFVVWTILLVGL